MTIAERNEIFLEHEYLIGFVIRKNVTLIRAFKLNYEDVRQELAICALNAIEKYNPSRGAALSTHIVNMMQYEILKMRRYHNRQCRAASVIMLSLNAGYADDEDGEEKTIDIPVIIDFDSDLYVQEITALMTENEIEVVNLKMNGVDLENRRQKRLMERAEKKVTRFYLMGGREAYAY